MYVGRESCDGCNLFPDDREKIEKDKAAGIKNWWIRAKDTQARDGLLAQLFRRFEIF